jgi:hypothetical protein
VTIWADADSLPEDVRRLICRRAALEARAAEASGQSPRFRAVFIAAKMPPIDLGPGVEAETVEEGEGAADDRIVERATNGDLAVTRDLPLAERLAEAGARVLNDRGDLFTAENVRERRSLRDRATELRALGLAPESPRRSSRGAREMKAFADALDRELAKKVTQ